MRNHWFYIFLLVVLAYVAINAQVTTTATNNATANATDDDDEEKEEHKDLRCFSCNGNVTRGCGKPFNRNDEDVHVQICPNHTLCYLGLYYDWFNRKILYSARGCIYDADGPRSRWKYYHYYCNFDLCNGTSRALGCVPFVLLPIFFLRYPLTNILR